MKQNVQYPKSYSTWTDDYGNEYVLPSDGDFPAGSAPIKGDHCGKCSHPLQVDDFRKYKGVKYGVSCGCAAEIPSLRERDAAMMQPDERPDEPEEAFDYGSL